MLLTFIITLILCLVFWGCCFLSTGGDDKNIKAYATYPQAVQEYVRKNTKLVERNEKSNILVSPNPVKTFLSNSILFLIVLFVLAWFVKTDDFTTNLIRVSIMGQGLNLFDYLVIDLLWWRRTKRIRFAGTEDMDELYQNSKKHTISFIKGIFMFFIVAVLDAWLLVMIG